MKIVFLSRLSRDWLAQIQILQEEFKHDLFITDPFEAEKELQTATAIVAGEIPLSVVQSANHLEIIFVPYAGIDGLPMPYIKAHDIRIANVHANAPYVAERAIAMALCFYGKMIEYHQDLKSFKWHGFWAGGGLTDTWNSIRGKACTVIGAGEIGKQIAKLLKAFECTVIGFKRRPVRILPDHFDEITLNIEEAIAKAELIFVSLPLTNETRGIIGRPQLMQMKEKFLVNVGRGEIINESALYEALKAGVLKGAAIDAWYAYPDKGGTEIAPSAYPFHELPNVILSPHVAGFTPESAKLNIAQTIENIRAYLKTGRAIYEVDKNRMY
ncbi:MAG: 2-hydroxyacid dehydrogenase [Pseudomonadota bacterium]